MRSTPRITEAEWDVMEVLWDDHPLTAVQVAAALERRRDWSVGTVKTLLRRLSEKGALRHVRDGKRFLYSPRVLRETCVRAEARSFLGRVFGGKASPMLAHFVREAKLDAKDIRELRRLLEEKEPKR